MSLVVYTIWPHLSQSYKRNTTSINQTTRLNNHQPHNFKHNMIKKNGQPSLQLPPLPTMMRPSSQSTVFLRKSLITNGLKIIQKNDQLRSSRGWSAPIVWILCPTPVWNWGLVTSCRVKSEEEDLYGEQVFQSCQIDVSYIQRLLPQNVVLIC